MHNYPIMKYFTYKHLPEHLQRVSRPFCELARDLAQRDDVNPAEMAAALRKLMEAKDAAVRAVLD